ncbi:MAG: aminoglycoside phosphotransferase family protein [Rhodospirillales bacterium]|nr:aminoglycoside phosphotransferase family protein [Rhodospirillales bacterium]
MKEWSRDIGGDILKAALLTWDIDHKTPYELIRIGSNMLFKLKNLGYVVRISRPGVDLDSATKRLEFVRALNQQDFPAIRLVPEHPPLILSNCHVTLWHLETALSQEINWGDFGKLIKDFQEAGQTVQVELPRHDPFEKIRERLDDIEERGLLEREDLAYFRAQHDRLKELYTSYKAVLKTSVIHGDAHVGNVIPTKKGLLLCDFDEVSIGPQEYDLVMSAVGTIRFNYDMKNFQALSSAYGYNILEDPQADILIQIRELTMMSWLCQNKGQSKTIDKEIAHRLNTVKNGDRYALWHPM